MSNDCYRFYKIGFILTYGFIFFSINVFSQEENRKIDSLKLLLEKSNSYNQKSIDYLNDLAKEYWFVNLDSVNFFSNKALGKSIKINYIKGKANALNNLGVVAYFKSNYVVAKQYYEESYDLFNELADTEGEMRCLMNIVGVERALGQWDKAYVSYKRLILRLEKMDDNKLLLVKGYYNISLVLLEEDKFEESLAYLQKTAQLAEQIDNKNHLALAYNNMGTVYSNMLAFENAILYYRKAIDIFIEVNNKQHEYFANVNLANNLKEIDENKQAELILTSVIEQIKDTDFSFVELYAYRVLGEIQLKNREYQLAEKSLLKAYKVCKQANDSYNLPLILMNLGKAYSELNNFELSIYYLKLANDHSLELNNFTILSRSYLAFHDVYKNQNDYKNALYYYAKYKDYKDSLFIKNREKVVSEIRVKYESEAKEKENELLKKENQIKDLEVDKQKTARNYLLLLSALSLITLGITYNRFRTKHKTAKVLAKQNSIINNQKIGLEKSNANKQRLFGIIAHDLVNPFNAILGYTDLLEKDYESFNDQERKSFIKTINKYAKSNYNLTKTLLDWAKIQQDELVVNKVKLNCNEIVELAIEPYRILADKKEIKIDLNISENITIEADQNMMQTVIGNLFVNAIKFTPQKGKIILNLNKNNDGSVAIEIEDNGIGMSQEQLNGLFDITKVSVVKGTNNEQGHGLGLLLCKELMELQKGTLDLFSQLHKGSKAVVSI